MTMWEEKVFLKDEQSLFNGRNFCVYGNNMVVVQGFKKLVSAKNDEIAFVYGNGFLSVLGQNLVIKKMSKGYAVVVGVVKQVVF
ncbi:MAG: hypothetical protein E7344_02410 [Clostridiales bacterium]|nr:hypothetical protein [Clostridiales bacterium]